MSHFAVMVFGDNPERLLKPYNENKEVPKYLVGEVREEELVSFLSYCSEGTLGDDELTISEMYKIHGDSWNGNRWEFDGDKVFEYSTYNPKSKWDWYQLGGRWTGYFKLKGNSSGKLGEPGILTESANNDYADSVRKIDIDIEYMRNKAEAEAVKVYDIADSLIKEFGDGFITFDQARSDNEDIDVARDVYNKQELVKAFGEKREYFGIFEKIEKYMMPREKFLQDARNNAFTPFAFVTLSGKWVESGKMGWFGMVSDEKDDWSDQFSKYFDNLPDDTMVHLFDCHI